MMPNQILPRFRLLLQYDIRPERYDEYYRYVTSEFIPAMQVMGLYMIGLWHTAYGETPVRQVEFVTEDLKTAQKAFGSEKWVSMESRLKSYTYNYTRKLVKYEERFQF